MITHSLKHAPDDGDELGHGEFVRYQELCFVQWREVLFLLVAFNDHLKVRESR